MTHNKELSSKYGLGSYIRAIPNCTRPDDIASVADWGLVIKKTLTNAWPSDFGDFGTLDSIDRKLGCSLGFYNYFYWMRHTIKSEAEKPDPCTSSFIKDVRAKLIITHWLIFGDPELSESSIEGKVPDRALISKMVHTSDRLFFECLMLKETPKGTPDHISDMLPSKATECELLIKILCSSTLIERPINADAFRRLTLQYLDALTYIIVVYRSVLGPLLVDDVICTMKGKPTLEGAEPIFYRSIVRFLDILPEFVSTDRDSGVGNFFWKLILEVGRISECA